MHVAVMRVYLNTDLILTARNTDVNLGYMSI